MTIAEVAAQLNMTRDGVYRLIKIGKLNATRVSGRVLTVEASDLETLINSGWRKSNAGRPRKESTT